MSSRLLLLVLAACNGGAQIDEETGDPVDTNPDGDTAADTDTEDTGEEETDTGSDDPIEDALDELEQPCTDLGPTDGSLDIVAGCAGAACVGRTYDQLAAAIGSAGECQEYTTYPGWVGCWWSDYGVSTSFRDEDQDGVPDRGEWNDGLYAYTPFAGGTTDGLAVGVAMACFVEILGYPDSVDFESTDDGYVPSGMTWNALGFGVWDFYTGTWGYGQDGFMDYMFLQGAPEGG
jgi:hypothetical protein